MTRSIRERGSGSGLVLIGAHGGAGVSTLHALLAPAAWELGTLRLADQGRPRFQLDGRPLVVVARGNVPGAARATEAVTAITGAGQPVAALAIIADGPEPKDATARFRMLSGRCGEAVRIPFVPALRLVDDPGEVALPKRADRALDELAELARIW